MTGPAHVLVLDVGKTNAKAALVDTATLAEIEVLTIPNQPRPGPPYPHADTEALWDFVVASARELNARHRVDALVTTTHGATAALLDADGRLALPILDYEHDGPDDVAAAYDAVRPRFAETGAPRLPAGLNLGAQLFWQAARFPDAFARTSAILPYPQYWAQRLCGIAATEATSLGAHTDLWNPHAAGYSSLLTGQGWAPRMPPLRRAAERLGPVKRQVAAATGLDPATPVLCGIHDSNASLLPHLSSRAPPFAVVSTGTWVIAMAIGGRAVELDPTRDTLINVSARGSPVPSARFMGGREWARITGGRDPAIAPADLDRVLDRGVMLLPAVEPGAGPFRGRPHGWSPPESGLAPAERAAAGALYLALVTAVCLETIGAEGPICVEGPFAANPAYLAMLAAATGRPVLQAGGATGTAAGAALLARDRPIVPSDDAPTVPPDRHRLAAYAAAWRRAVAVEPDRRA